MNCHPRLRRRTFLRRAAEFTLLISVPPMAACKRDAGGGATSDRPSASGSVPRPSGAVEAMGAAPLAVEWKFYTQAQGRTLSAVVERLLPGPSGGGMPSAATAGVAGYIDGQLALPTFRGLSRMMRAGMQFIDKTAQREAGTAFHELPAERQDRVLKAFQTGTVGHGMRFPQARFFDQLLRFSLEGYLGAPEHGGNRDACVWKALSIDPRCHNMYERCG